MGRGTTLSNQDNDLVLDDVYTRQVFGDAPENAEPPRLTGSATTGGQLACSQGTWDTTAATFTFQFRRDGAPIAGATAVDVPGHYTVQSADVGKAIDCVVTATNDTDAVTGPATPSSRRPSDRPAQRGRQARRVRAATGATGPTGPPAGPPGPAGPVTTPVLSLFAYMTQSSYSGKASKTFTLRYVATGTATVKLTVKRGSKTVTTVSAKSKKGRNKLKISKKKLKKSGRYSLTLTATGSDGQKATDKAKLTIAKKRRR